MSRTAVSIFVIAVLTLLTAPASAGSRIPGNGGLMPIPDPQLQMRRRMVEEPPPAKSPYSMTYSEQVAQSLGVREGGVSLYESKDAARNPYAPSVSLGGTMLRLRWSP
jgi:hypothetical protein